MEKKEWTEEMSKKRSIGQMFGLEAEKRAFGCVEIQADRYFSISFVTRTQNANFILSRTNVSALADIVFPLRSLL